ncbi:NAD(P)-dependent dehydrogenase (short-subunit alcohol dehydrogenase family) [Nonomuraea thailandensis]|uniref:NAD(P)-dependent dehydrogenase (Short-subunit alcohol dehydrogenase family) n=1 Tax=Nonomuraea thailandensis TaxID=1188745 RepID=A0A9X2GQM4_9ACTN|nr:SDR family NAD(P)-dependent oxidoreductase [Nonomuraea thailandensis]MCP2362142.1 NAD(P)-dependent dehydrogenase (short-subunit alcohol dehydrogenase family) [Nonomuraea thailandensis]
MRELSGKVAVVTGAASGIGRALALRFAAEGMTLMLADVDHGGLAETAALAGDVEVLTQITDVSDAWAVRHLANRCFGELGAVHVLCNNAGVFQGGHMWTRDEEDFSWLLGVNLWGVLHGVHEFVPRMIEQDTEGHIVNTVSVAGLFASPGSGGYSVTKYAALAASLSLAQDLTATGSKLRVSALCPGAVRTRIGDSDRTRPAGLATTPTADEVESREWVSRAAERGMEPSEVAGLVVTGIREERFLLLTDPRYAERLREQTETLLTGSLPGYQ